MSLPPPPEGEGPPSPRATVLVASSDSATRDLLRRVLDVPAVEVVDASDGVEALALARRLDLDLVVLDAFLAVMDGLTVCARIRALGVEAPGSYREFGKLTSIAESEGSPDASEMIRQLAQGQEAVVRTARSVFPDADAAHDEPTADLLTQRMQVHEKNAWMLRSLLEK